MKYVTAMIIAVLLVIEAVMPFSSQASIGTLLKGAGREISEFAARKGGKEVIEEGSKIGSEEAAEFLARYGVLGRRAFKIVGDDIVELAARFGREGVEMCASHSAAEARFLVKHADEAIPIWRQFGRQGTELMVQHPGIAKPLLDVAGRRGLAVAEKVSEESLVRLTYFSKRISKENLDEIITWLLAKGDNVMDFLWRHKGKIITGTAVYTLLKDYDQGITDTLVDSDGNPIEVYESHNFLEHFINTVTNHTLVAYPWLPVAIGIILFLFIVVKLKLFWSMIRKLFVKFTSIPLMVKGWFTKRHESADREQQPDDRSDNAGNNDKKDSSPQFVK